MYMMQLQCWLEVLSIFWTEYVLSMQLCLRIYLPENWRAENMYYSEPKC